MNNSISISKQRNIRLFLEHSFQTKIDKIGAETFEFNENTSEEFDKLQSGVTYDVVLYNEDLLKEVYNSNKQAIDFSLRKNGSHKKYIKFKLCEVDIADLVKENIKSGISLKNGEYLCIIAEVEVGNTQLQKMKKNLIDIEEVRFDLSDKRTTILCDANSENIADNSVFVMTDLEKVKLKYFVQFSTGATALVPL